MIEMFMSNFTSVLCRKEGWVTERSECILKITRGHIRYKPRNQFWAKKGISRIDLSKFWRNVLKNDFRYVRRIGHQKVCEYEIRE